uniref:Uncharacterized protein n=1 Tax=viral metagenome TaxID=1070528 RepID=A0A6M3L9J4_9ZZZZ
MIDEINSLRQRVAELTAKLEQEQVAHRMEVSAYRERVTELEQQARNNAAGAEYENRRLNNRVAELEKIIASLQEQALDEEELV